jgi:hypothetical protein
MSDDSPEEAPDDVVVVQGPTEKGVAVVRVRKAGEDETSVEVGELRPLAEGQPIHGEVLKLSQRPASERVYDVEVVAPAPRAAKSVGSDTALPHKGPARVATEAYRSNWEGIFGGTRSGGAPN